MILKAPADYLAVPEPRAPLLSRVTVLGEFAEF